MRPEDKIDARGDKVFLHITRKPELCYGNQPTMEHKFTGWRQFEDGNGGEQVCKFCGMGAMAHSLATSALGEREGDGKDSSIDTFGVGDRTVRARRPLSVSIRFDREEQLFMATVPSLGIETAGETRDDVAEGIAAELRMLWRNYAQADDARLTEGARSLKRRLLETFEEAPDAA